MNKINAIMAYLLADLPFTVTKILCNLSADHAFA